MRGKHLFQRLKRRLTFLAQHLKVRHLHGPRQIPYSMEEVIALSVVRNGEIYTKSFIEHHFSLGVKHIVFLDNGSTDKTIEIARRYPNITILRTKQPYKKYEKLMKEYLVRRFSTGRWNLFVDIDELFDYPASDTLSFEGLLRYLNQNSYGAVVSQMLDLFSDQPLQTLSNDCDQDIKTSFQFYDISDIDQTDYIWGTSSNDSIKMHWGGIRKKMFGSRNGLTKAPLTFIDEQIQLFVDWHHVRKARIADFSAVLYHYPFTCYFHQKVQEAIQTNRYPPAAEEYKMYWRRVQNETDLKISTETSRLLTNINELVSNGFLVVSPNYKKWVLQN